MKAEHRKELETNALADRVGRAVQGLKQAPQKRTLLWVLVAVVIVGFSWLYVRRGEVRRVENSVHWLMFENQQQQYLSKLIQEDSQSTQSKAAQYEMNYANLRNLLKLLPTNPKKVLESLDSVDKKYAELATLCKDDKVLLPEALFGKAVIEETRIMRDDDNWKVALNAYKELADNHKETAFGKLAQQRYEVLNDKDKRETVLNIYRDLRIKFDIEDRLPTQPPEMPAGHPPVPPFLQGIPK